MTKKDYQILADAIEEVYIIAENDEVQVVREVAIAIADVLERDNPRFDRDIFLESACDIARRAGRL
jgi:hypothetical protein